MMLSRALVATAPCAVRALPSIRCLSAASGKMVNVEHRDGVAVVKMNRAPVNSLNLELMTELREAITASEKDKSVKALVLGSDVPRIFSAGLDIMEMYQPKDGRLEQFWTSLQDLWLALYGCKLPTIAAVSGATLLGIVAPPFFSNTLISTVGQRHAEHMLSLGLMLPAAQALKIGVVDELAPENEVLEKAVAEAKKWGGINAQARIATKLQLRGPNLEALRKTKEEDLQRFVNFARHPSVQASLGQYLEALRAKSKN